MKKGLLKVIGVSFALALVLNAIVVVLPNIENPPLFGSNTITQSHNG